MSDQLQLLAELQQLDSRLRVLEAEQQVLPQQLHAYQQACQQARDELAASQLAIEEAERRRRSLERDIDSGHERLNRAQSRLHEVKTNKEYSAALAEIESGKQRISTLEDQVLELMEGAEQQQDLSQRSAQRLQEASGELADRERVVSEAQDALGKDIAARRGERDDLIARLQPDYHTAYQQAARRAGSIAVVEVMRDESCGGCYLRIRPQLISELRKQEGIVSCPHCKRILLWPASEAETV